MSTTETSNRENDNSTAGDAVKDGITWLLSHLYMIFIAALVVGFVLGVVALDLGLGPNFMTAYAESNGLQWGILVPLAAWSFSVATTGFQYALVGAILAGVDIRSGPWYVKLAWAVGFAMCIVDSVTDLGGFTSIFWGAEQGMGIIPDNASFGFWSLGGPVFVFCLGQELILVPLLKKGVTKAVPEREIPGTFWVEWAIDGVAWLYGAIRGVAVGLAALAAVSLNVFLIAYYMRFRIAQDEALIRIADYAGVAMGLGFAALAYLMFRRVRSRKLNLGIRLRRKKEDDFPDSSAATVDYWAYAVLAFAGLNVFLAVSSFTMMMYGPQSGVVPTNPPIAWYLIGITIIILCLFSTPMMYVALSRDQMAGIANRSSWKFWSKGDEGDGELKGWRPWKRRGGEAEAGV